MKWIKENTGVLWLLLAVVALVVVFTRTNNADPYKQINEQYQKMIEEKEKEQDSLKSHIKSTEELEKRLAERDNAIISKIEGYQSQIIKIKQGYEKINRFDSYSSSDITKYFADSLYR